VGKIAEKAIWHGILSAELTKTHSLHTPSDWFLSILPTGKKSYFGSVFYIYMMYFQQIELKTFTLYI